MLSKEEYQVLNAKEMDSTSELIQKIEGCEDSLIERGIIRPILDVKHMFETSVEKYGDRTAFWVKKDSGNAYSPISYNEAYRDVRGLGAMLIEMGMSDKRIAVVGEGSYEWTISYLTAICATGAVVPLDKELSANELKYFLNISKCSGVIFSGALENTFMNIKNDGVTGLEIYVNMDRTKSEAEILSLRELINSGVKISFPGNSRFTKAQSIRDEICAVSFTSGAANVSKGVMTSHGNIITNIMSVSTLLDINESDLFFSLLPVHHALACILGLLTPLYMGASVACGKGYSHIENSEFRKTFKGCEESEVNDAVGGVERSEDITVSGCIEKPACVEADLREVKPSILLGAPVQIENLYKNIQQKAYNLGRKDMNRSAVEAVFGCKIRLVICGGDFINSNVLQGLQDFSVQALQCYSITESTGIAALSPPHGSTLRLLPGMKANIAYPDPETAIGEICLDGENVMMGYCNDPEATAIALKDGWLYTGDLGRMDECGDIYLIGRKSNLIANIGNKLCPEELEYKLNNLPYVRESMVWKCSSGYEVNTVSTCDSMARKNSGDYEVSRGSVVESEVMKNADEGKAWKQMDNDIVVAATVLINEEEVAKTLGEDYSEEELEKLLWNSINDINSELPDYKKIRKIVRRREGFQKNSSSKIIRYYPSNRECST